MISEIISILEKKDRPFLSNIFYIISGIIMFVVFSLYVLPIKFNIPLLNNIDIKHKLTKDEPIIVITFFMIFAYLIVYVYRTVLLYFSKNMSDTKYKIVFSILYTIEDTLDLAVSIFSVIVMLCIIVQFYKTNQFFTAKIAYFLYAFFSLKVFIFIIYKIYAINNKIVNDV